MAITESSICIVGLRGDQRLCGGRGGRGRRGSPEAREKVEREYEPDPVT